MIHPSLISKIGNRMNLLKFYRVETMALRLEDINVKESSLRLSMQTIDFRLGRLEEMALNTNDCLNHLRSFITQSSATSPNSVGKTYYMWWGTTKLVLIILCYAYDGYTTKIHEYGIITVVLTMDTKPVALS